MATRRFRAFRTYRTPDTRIFSAFSIFSIFGATPSTSAVEGHGLSNDRCGAQYAFWSLYQRS